MVVVAVSLAQTMLESAHFLGNTFAMMVKEKKGALKGGNQMHCKVAVEAVEVVVVN